MASGGYREPRNPAPASGPGRLSRRTDGGPAQRLTHIPNAQYGEDAANIAVQRAAPLSQADMVATAAMSTPQQPIVPLDAPTQFENEPVTSGVDVGPGVGSSALRTSRAIAGSYGALSDMLSALAPEDMSGSIAALAQAAAERGV